MRPQEIKRSINLAFKKFMSTAGIYPGIHVIYILNENPFLRCKRHLEKRLQWHIKQDSHSFAIGKKLVAQYIPMISADDQTKIRNYMEYISDRWDCAHRIMIILEFIKFYKYMSLSNELFNVEKMLRSSGLSASQMENLVKYGDKLDYAVYHCEWSLDRRAQWLEYVKKEKEIEYEG